MFRPLLAPREDPLSYPNYFKGLRYPLLVSPKYDGIRCIIKDNTALSRTGKMLPSLQVQEEFTRENHIDGELIVGNPTDFDVYNRTQSHVMSEDKPAEISYFAFDYTGPAHLHKPFIDRLEVLAELTGSSYPNVFFVKHDWVENEEELLEMEEKYLREGYEGVILRDPMARYKNGRGTFREGIIYKLKRFTDDEAVIVALKEKMTNTNEQERDELGYAKRSHKQEGKVGAGMVGAFLVKYGEDILEIAPGSFTHQQLTEMWEYPSLAVGATLKFRYFNHGIKDKPRFPRATGFRTGVDM
jgi:DNA ligase 1